MSNFNIDFKPLKKQWHAWQYLNDNETTEVLYGGSAGSGKTELGCAWIIINCISKPETRWLIARNELNNLKSTTMKTFLDVCKKFDLKRDVHFFWSGNSNEIKFWNGSEIVLRELFAYPSDPDFDSLGSLEITGAFIDEASQVVTKAKDVVKSRIRYKLNEYNIIPKLLMTCNPSKNFTYHQFYKPFKENKLEPFRKFVPALPTDNPFLPEEYLKTLGQLDKASKQRLLYGNWEYADDDNSLMTYDDICDSFTNDHIVIKENGIIKGTMYDGKLITQKYITVDVARKGKDNTIIIVWHALKIIDIVILKQETTDVTAKKIKELQSKYIIPVSNICIDTDGVGGGVSDYFKGSYEFLNGGSSLNGENYLNLKTQCYYWLAKLITTKQIYFDIQDYKIKEDLIEELEQVKRKNADKDSKLQILSKDEVKQNIGRSPDISDTIMMRMVYLLKKTGFIGVGGF